MAKPASRCKFLEKTVGNLAAHADLQRFTHAWHTGWQRRPLILTRSVSEASRAIPSLAHRAIMSRLTLDQSDSGHLCSESPPCEGAGDEPFVLQEPWSLSGFRTVSSPLEKGGRGYPRVTSLKVPFRDGCPPRNVVYRSQRTCLCLTPRPQEDYSNLPPSR